MSVEEFTCVTTVTDSDGDIGVLSVDEAEDAYRMKEKLNSTKLIQSLFFKPTSSCRINIPLCRLVQMPKVRPVLISDVRRLETEFIHGYREGDRVFYVSMTDDTGRSQAVTEEIIDSWDLHWKEANDIFEKKLRSKVEWKSLEGSMFFIWDGNHRHSAWIDYITRFHSSDLDWHYSVDSIILTSKGRQGALLNAMSDINR